MDPVTEISYLGFILDSSTMTLALPESKIEKISVACKQLLNERNPSVRDVSQLTGLLVSNLPAVNNLQLYYRSLELCKIEALSNSTELDYDFKLSLSEQARNAIFLILMGNYSRNSKLIFT